MRTPVIREKLLFYGRVQGVGFRYRFKYAAGDLDLTGWVKNRYDGNVEAEVQGSRESITKLISEVSKGRFVRITGIERNEIPVVDGERSFKVESW